MAKINNILSAVRIYFLLRVRVKTDYKMFYFKALKGELELC